MNNLRKRHLLLTITIALSAVAQENLSTNTDLSDYLWNNFKTCIDKKTSFFGYNQDKDRALNPDYSEEIRCQLGKDYFYFEKEGNSAYLKSYIHRTGDSEILSDSMPKARENRTNYYQGKIEDNNSDCSYLIGLSNYWHGNPDLIKRFKNYSCHSQLRFDDFVAFMKKQSKK